MDNSHDNHSDAALPFQLNTATAGQRLKYIRNMLRLTRAYLHQKYALSPDSLKAWESGKLKLTQKALDRCIKIYSKEGAFVSKHWILTGEGMRPKLSLSIASYFDMPHDDLALTSLLVNDEELVLREIAFFKSTSPYATVMLVSKDDMLPCYQVGDYVGGRFSAPEKLDQYVGKDCIIETIEGERYFRRLSLIEEDGNCHLNALNPQDNVEPLVYHRENMRVALVVWIRRREIG